jgi:predicted Abi (CAAX) family protease
LKSNPLTCPPAFAILAFMSARNRGLGLILTLALYVLGATLLFPVGLPEFIKPFFVLPTSLGGLALYLGISFCAPLCSL